MALFAASVPPAIIGLGIAAAQSDETSVALPIAWALWAIAALAALAAAFPTLRYWEGLSNQTRWLGALPLLVVALFLGAALAGSLL